MADAPWLDDACSLVDAFRAGDLSPVEALDATLGAIERSELGAFSHVDREAARATAEAADVSLPFGGMPVGIKELDYKVAGWPRTEGSLVFRDRVSTQDSTAVARLRAAGAVLVGLTTASEFGGVNFTRTRLNGTTRNPWDRERTPGGSSGGTAAAVAGGLVPIAAGADGGGSIRIPAGFCGLVGLKTNFGRIPKGPMTEIEPLTVTTGCLSRSVRDTARWLDVCSGFDSRDPLSLPRVDGWEAGLGTHDLRGLRAAVVPTLGAAVVHPEVAALVEEAAGALIARAGLRVVEPPVKLPVVGLEWALAGLVGVRANLGERWPECADDLTSEMRFGLQLGSQLYGLDSAAQVESRRRELNETMAALFDEVDFVFCATNPDVAFAADGPMPTRVGDELVELNNNGALTIPANIYGNPAISVPAGVAPSSGLPVGLQVMARHHAEALLLDLALVAERERPWPLVAPAAPC